MNDIQKIPSVMDMMLDSTVSERVMRIADTLAAGRCAVPDHLKGNRADCLSVTIQALLWGINPFSAAQCSFVIHGRLGYESKLIVAALQSTRAIEGSLEHEKIGDWAKILSKRPRKTNEKPQPGYEPDDENGLGGRPRKTKEKLQPGYEPDDENGLGVRVTGKIRNKDKPVSHELFLCNAWPRQSTQWAVNPWMQLCYTADRQFARLYCPATIFGVYTEDEIIERDVTPQVEVEQNPLPVVTPKKISEQDVTPKVTVKLDPNPGNPDIEFERSAEDSRKASSARSLALLKQRAWQCQTDSALKELATYAQEYNLLPEDAEKLEQTFCLMEAKGFAENDADVVVKEAAGEQAGPKSFEEKPLRNLIEQEDMESSGKSPMIDAAGTVFDPGKHGVTKEGVPSLTKSGMFRAKRGSRSPSAPGIPKGEEKEDEATKAESQETQYYYWLDALRACETQEQVFDLTHEFRTKTWSEIETQQFLSASSSKKARILSENAEKVETENEEADTILK